MKQIEKNNQYFEKLTSRAECAAWLKDVKDAQILPDEGGLFIEYLDGTFQHYDNDDDLCKVRTSNVKTMIYDGGYGTTYYNAVPQLDTTYPDDPYIRIGTEAGEYGETIKL